MKYVIVQGDGMADHSLESLSGRTPLEAATTPNMDEVASSGLLGTVTTIPSGLPPGSSVGNMSLMGLEPEKYYTGRASLEARGQGIEVGEDDVVFRLNLVRTEGNGEVEVMKDYSGGHPSSEKAKQFVDLLEGEVVNNGFNFYSGVSYRNLVVWEGGRNEFNHESISLTPPHDITGEPVEGYLPEGPGSEQVREIQEIAKEVLEEKDESFNGVWLWGPGVKPDLPSFKKRYGLTGAVISAVDLIKGLGAYSGLEPVGVEGATGDINTNYEGKVRAVKENLGEDSIVFLHLEAPDEASHAGDLELKIEAIERIDERIIGPLLNYLSEEKENYRLLVATDHITGLETRTHERGRVPFAIVDSGRSNVSRGRKFAERDASEEGNEFETGTELIDLFFRKEDMNDYK
ncbi:MAG: cofactor-independent phosphoglycerate mutase [Candidatus Bipolaricaulia bacterium]